MKRPVLIDTEAMIEVLDQRKLTSAQKRRGEGVLPQLEVQNLGSGKKKKTATMYLFDEIAWWSANSAREFRRQLAELDAEEIHLHINSPGGSVFEGVTIYNLLADHPADVIVHIDGLAASIASVIALCGDRIEIAENAMVMIHDPSVIAWGNAEVMRKQAEVLDRIKDAILNTYESRTKLGRESLALAMAEETWYSADEAVTAGFASVKVDASKAAALWEPGEFEGMPEAALMLGKKPETRDKKPEAEPELEQEAETPALKGTVEDVSAAEDLISRIRALHGL